MNKKTTLTKIFALIVVIAMMTCVFSACNLFDKVTKITQVDVSVANDLTKAEDGSYLVGINGEISLSVDWHNFMIDKPNIRWYVATNGGEKSEINGEKGKTLKFTASALGSTYEFSVSANGVESGKISVKVVSGVANVVIQEPTTLGEKNGAGQYEVEAGSEFSLTANWQDTVAGSKAIAWSVAANGGDKVVKPSQTTTTTTWNFVESGSYEIYVSVNGVECAAPIKLSVVAGGPVEITFEVQASATSARYGETVDLSVDFGSLVIDNPTIEWFVRQDSGEWQKLSSDKYTIASRDVSYYDFKAVYKGEEDVESTNTARVTFVDFTLEQVALLTEPTIVEGKIQQNVCEPMQNVALTAVWNETELPSDVVTFEWRVDNVVQDGETAKTFTFDVTGISTACEKTVKVTIRYKSQTVYTTVVLSFVEEYLPIANVSLEVQQNAQVSWLGELRSTYNRKDATTSNPGTVTVSANVTPDGTNLASDCTWTVRDMAGTRTLAEKDRTVTIPLAYGKNVITATIQNMESRSVIVYALTHSDLTDRRKAINATFIWNGSVQDHYINNQEELNIFVGYLVSTHETAENSDDENVHEVYLAPNEWRDGLNTSSEFNRNIVVDGQNTLDPTCALGIAMNLGLDESGAPIVAHLGNTKFWLSTSSILGEPTEPIFTDYHVSQERVYVRYTTISDLSDERRNKVPADDFSETMLVKNSNQLVRALSWGYKPTFEDNAAGTQLSLLYNRAKQVLLDYVGRSMTDLEKVGIIYDWLVNEVDYDYAAYDYTGADSVSYNAYYLEGVFNDHRAVCDGKSKAFALLCGMEGIRAMRIIGEANGGGHAWNKVLIDVDGDGIREWFAVDCTWGDIGMNTETYHEKKEILTYEYFLTTDTHMAATHASDMAQPVANTDFDVYENIAVNGSTLDVTTRERLELLYAYSLAHEKVKIRCRISDDAKAHIPAGAAPPMYLTDDEEDVYYYFAS